MKQSREELRAEILGEVAEEQALAWRAELDADAKRKTKLLNHDKPEPDPLRIWENMSQKADIFQPGAAELLEYAGRNELGDAELFQAMHEGKYTLDCSQGQHGKWYYYDGVIWQPDMVSNAKRLAMTMLPEQYERGAFLMSEQLSDEQAKAEQRKDKINIELAQAEAEMDDIKSSALKDKLKDADEKLANVAKSLSKSREFLRDRARALRGSTRATNVLKVSATGNNSLGLSGKEWERHPCLFAAANGIIDLETGRIIRSRPDLYLQMASPFPYMGLHAVSDWWDDHLRKIFCNDERLIDYFEWAIGYSMTGLRFNKDIYVAFGPKGDNGKSATFNTILLVAGSYTTTIKVEVLLEDKMAGKGPDPDVLVLDGLRMGVAGEADKKAKFSMKNIKSITGGDSVRARGLYADSKIIESFVKLWLHTNDVPNIYGFDPGFMLRLKLLPFKARFTGKRAEIDPAKHVYAAMDQNAFKLMQQREAPLILSWLMRCARKFFLTPHMVPPDSVEHMTKDYFEDQDIIGEFINHCCILRDGEKTQFKYLYAAFRRYCKDELGIKEDNIIKHRTLGTDLAKRFEKDAQNKVYYLGVCLKPEWEEQGKLGGSPG